MKSYKQSQADGLEGQNIMSADLFMTNPVKAMRTPEQLSIDEYQDATSVFVYLGVPQRLLPVWRARVPLAANKDVAVWAQYWREIKGGLVWCGYNISNLIRAANG